MTSTEEKLTNLRSTLSELSNFQEQYDIKRKADATDAAATTNVEAFPNPRLLKRYRTARNTYIHRRTLQMFVEMMSTYDADANTFALPTVSPEERAEQQTKNEEVLNALKSTMERVDTLRKENREGYAEFERKRMELADIVSRMERSVANSEADDGEDIMDDEVITEEDVEAQEEELSKLAERREMLEHKLRLVRGQIAHVESEVSETQKAVNEVRVKTGRKPIEWREESAGAEGVEFISVKESVDAEVAEMQEKIEQLKNSSEFYQGMKELMEELGGIKILESAKGDDEYSIKFMLLDSHILELNLEQNGKSLRVATAKLLTSTSLPVPQVSEEETTNLMETIHSFSISNISFSKLMSQKPSSAINIRPLDDLVSYSHELESSHGIRFVVSETLARIRTAQARIVELTKLKTSYAYQVYDVDDHEQEVVCALNEGISVALRLGADCPLVKGSVYISELCGVGGWEEEKLQELKAVVDERRCRGPVEVMEVLSEEIKRRTKDEGWKLPLTPVLMRGSGGD